MIASKGPEDPTYRTHISIALGAIMCCDVLVFETTSLCLATALRPPQLEGNGASKLWNLRFVCDVLGGGEGECK